jgi:hypothetical protein
MNGDSLSVNPYKMDMLLGGGGGRRGEYGEDGNILNVWWGPSLETAAFLRNQTHWFSMSS